MYKKWTRAGSITVFASLSLMLVASFLLALLEQARYAGLAAYSGMQRENAVESLLSEYDRDLFDRYGIFLLDAGFESGNIEFSKIDGLLLETSQKNLRPESTGGGLFSTENFYQMDVTKAQMERYLLATDENGAPFRAMAAASMKTRYPLELLESLSQQADQSSEAMEQANETQASMDAADLQISQAKQQSAEAAKSAENGEGETTVVSADPPENPIDVVKTIKSKDILSLVVPQGKALSQKSVDRTDALEKRSLVSGNETWDHTADPFETVLYHKFLETQFGCFTAKSASSGALEYELEYIVAGKDTDHGNLKSVVRRLLLLREGANFLYLQKDAVKKGEAYELATAIAAAFAVPPAIPILTQGILAAWAYGESILDVRALLAGDKIPWLKTSESWTCDLTSMGSLLSGDAKAKSSDDGEDYEGYLHKLLYLTSARSSSYRAMDLMEWYHDSLGEGKIRMDGMMVSVTAVFSYEAQPLFSKLVSLQRLKTEHFVFEATVSDSYL